MNVATGKLSQNLPRPDTIYTIPRNGDWSPAAMGGVQAGRDEMRKAVKRYCISIYFFKTGTRYLGLDFQAFSRKCCLILFVYKHLHCWMRPISQTFENLT